MDIPCTGGDGGGGPVGTFVPPGVMGDAVAGAHGYLLGFGVLGLGDLRLDPLLQVSLLGGGGGIPVDCPSCTGLSEILSEDSRKGD